MAWTGWTPDPHITWRAGLWMVRSVRGGGAHSPLIELSWGRTFGMAPR